MQMATNKQFCDQCAKYKKEGWKTCPKCGLEANSADEIVEHYIDKIRSHISGNETLVTSASAVNQLPSTAFSDFVQHKLRNISHGNDLDSLKNSTDHPKITKFIVTYFYGRCGGIDDIVTAVNPDDKLKKYLGRIDEPIFVCGCKSRGYVIIRKKVFEEHFPWLKTKADWLRNEFAINAQWKIYCPFRVLYVYFNKLE